MRIFLIFSITFCQPFKKISIVWKSRTNPLKRARNRLSIHLWRQRCCNVCQETTRCRNLRSNSKNCGKWFTSTTFHGTGLLAFFYEKTAIISAVLPTHLHLPARPLRCTWIHAPKSGGKFYYCPIGLCETNTGWGKTEQVFGLLQIAS